MVKRNIVRIDEELCDGCGLCVSPCAEGAIEIRDGKARVIREELCDGAGVCLDVCPRGALSIEKREAPAFNQYAAQLHMAERRRAADSRFSCTVCGSGDTDRALLPIRQGGKNAWICVKCLPALIHGK